jgi:hypothetical protein
MGQTASNVWAEMKRDHAAEARARHQAEWDADRRAMDEEQQREADERQEKVLLALRQQQEKARAEMEAAPGDEAKRKAAERAERHLAVVEAARPPHCTPASLERYNDFATKRARVATRRTKLANMRRAVAELEAYLVQEEEAFDREFP